VLLFGSLQLIFVSVQPLGGPFSVHVYVLGGKPDVDLLFDSVPSASSSNEKLPMDAEQVKLKSWASLGTASLVIVILPSIVFVKVQVTLSPAARAIVAVPVPGLSTGVDVVVVPPEGSTHTRLVSCQPLGRLSLHVYVPGRRPV
jgi:hypothetical protein